MTAVLVDSNVLLDVLTADARWLDWSSRAIAELGSVAPLVINPVIFAEISVRAATVEEVDAAFPPAYFRREPIPWTAAFLAGKAFLAYQRRGGTRRSPLPDFFIGAHAAVAGYRLLTRDAARYRSYFQGLDLVTPG